MNKEQSTLRTIDLFCGAGGSSYGARMAGAEIVAGFDIWDPALQAYKINFPEAKTFGGDIRKLKPRNIKKKIGKIDLILASPECTSHSVAKGGKERSEESKLTAFEVTRFARVFKPKMIIIENVTSMRSWSEHPRLLEELWDCKYFVREVKLNAKNFGTPQSRNRLFLLCSLDRKVQAPVGTHENHIAASTIIDWTDKYKFTLLFSDKRAVNTLERAERAIGIIGRNEPFLLVYYGTDKGGGWQRIDRPLRTITTLDRFALVKPTNKGHVMRMLQPEELKKAMGYGDDYNLNFGLTRRNQIKLMGNGVCPPVMEAIVSNIVDQNQT